MTDFLFSTRSLPPGTLAGALRSFLEPVIDSVEEVSGPWGMLAVTRRPGAEPSHRASEHGWSVVVGEPLVALPGPGRSRLTDPAARAAVHDALLASDPGDWARWMDGMWAAVGVKADGSVRVVTDRFGFIPVFETRSGGWMIGTHVDALAIAAGLERRYDPVSLADQVIHLTCTFPFTAYEGIRQLPPGEERGVEPASARIYWRPREDNPFDGIPEAGAALREAVQADLRDACAGLDDVGLLLSGGEDSRALLGAMPDVRVNAFTYAGAVNREVRVARSVARAYGAGFSFGERGAAHYETGLPAVGRMVGSPHLFMDVHGYGLHHAVGLDRLPLVVGGLSADSLLKGAYSRPAGASQPPPRIPAGLRQGLADAVADRRAAFLGWLREVRPETAAEWSVLWPFSMRKHGGNVHGNRRLFASHEAFHASGVLDVAAAAPASWKRGRRLFVAAMRPLLRRSWYVPHARSRYPYFGAGPNLLLGALLRAGRGARDLALGELRLRQGPWPRWAEVAGSAATDAAWRRYPLEDSALRDLFLPELEPAAIRASLRALHPLGQMMALQLAMLTGDER